MQDISNLHLLVVYIYCMYSDLINVMYSMLADTVELHVENMFGAVMLIRILIPHGSAFWKSSWIRIGMKHIFLSGRFFASLDPDPH